VIRELIKVKDSYNCDSISIAGATAAIEDQAWLKETRTAILATRARMTGELREMGFNVVDSNANFVWCTLDSTPVEPIYRELKQAGVLVRYMLYPNWGDGLRITVGSDEQVDACLGLLKGLV
jgi:histidinol-phosphate aminotransferase